MTLQEMIYHRKTTRSFSMEPIDKKILDDILEFASKAKRLHPDIRIRSEIIGLSDVRCFLPWKTSHYIAFFSEVKEGYGMNVGFVAQQVELYAQTIGLGCCWLGMGQYNPKCEAEYDSGTDMPFVIMIAIGKPKGNSLRESISEFRRKPLSEICDHPDQKLEPARLAPSGVNRQPWYFTHDGDSYHLWYVPKGVLSKPTSPSLMNQIDLGCALAHLYVSNPDSFRFWHEKLSPQKKGLVYAGSFKI